MKYLLFFLLFPCCGLHAQTGEIKGVVINGTDHTPLSSASVFINNTSKGTTSDASGNFTLGGITEKNFDLVISYVGFGTVSLKITPANIDQFLTVTLVPRKETLQEISILIPEKDGWEKWGKFFTESFVGQSDFAHACRIENPKVLKFFNDKKNNRLTVYSDGPLLIRNDALGYLVRYQLEEFNYDFKEKITTYAGYMVFEHIKTRSARKKRRWVEARKEAYAGSIMEFMRALYADSVTQKGFLVKEKIRILRADTLFKKIYLPGNMPTVRIGADSYKSRAGQTSDFKKIPDYVDLVNVKPFSFGDAVSFDSSAQEKQFYFDHYIEVIYTKIQVKKDYLLAHELPEHLKMFPFSDARLMSEESLMIQKDGSYFNPTNMMSSGYWGWLSLAEMLPTDYREGE
jgi:hypothetical protein